MFSFNYEFQGRMDLPDRSESRRARAKYSPGFLVHLHRSNLPCRAGPSSHVLLERCGNTGLTAVGLAVGAVPTLGDERRSPRRDPRGVPGEAGTR